MKQYCRYCSNFCCGNGDRVITKVKCEDFEIKEEIK